MKWFWFTVLALLIALGAIMLRRAVTAPASTPTTAPSTSPRTASEVPVDAGDADQPAPTPSRPSSTTAGETPSTRPAASDASSGVRELPGPSSSQPAGPTPTPAAPGASDGTPASARVEPAPRSVPTDAELARQAAHQDKARTISEALDDALGMSSGTPVVPPPPSSGSSAQPGAAKPSSDKPAASDPGAPVKLVPQDDGSVLVDDKFIIKGKGTKDDPYRVTWEMLVSAEQTYQPRLGRKVIPERLKMLDNKWLKISGYVAFPIMAQSQDEMLMMLNQWDGCCIGVPPTPYDAIEVKLKNPAKGDDRLRASGTITGLFRVDPYLVKDWLVSLYLMDQGEVSGK